ncbi:MAG: hypothetical protein V3V08_20705 [Nannocystaceae bacterium]
MDLGNGRIALVRAMGGKKRFRIRATHIFFKKLPAIKPRPWLRPAAAFAMRAADQLFADAMTRAIDKARE